MALAAYRNFNGTFKDDMNLNSTDINRFERSIFKTEGCWNCQLACKENGYVATRLTSGKMEYMHRIAYYLETGINPGELLVCHTCDNRKCCNPEHLFLGTYQDNADDKVNKNRQMKNETHPNHVLTNAQVKQIRFLSGLGIQGIELSKKFKTSRSNICKIINNKQRKVI